MKYIPKISILISAVALILDIAYVMVGNNIISFLGIGGNDLLRLGLTLSHMAIAMSLVCNAYSKIKKISLEYAGISLVLSIIVFASPAIIAYITILF